MSATGESGSPGDTKLSKESNEKLNLFNSNYNFSEDSILLDSLSKRTSFLYQPLDVFKEAIDFYVLVLKGNTKSKTNCEDFLTSLCETLVEELPGGPFSSILNRICGHKAGIDGVCLYLSAKSHQTGYTPVEKRCHDLENRLAATYNDEDLNSEDGPRRLGEEYCTKLETLCNIYRTVCDDYFFGKCIMLLSKCFQSRVEDYQTSFLLSLMKGHLTDLQSCIPSFQHKCVCFSTMNPQMIDMCLLPSTACERLIRLKEQKCGTLESIILKSSPESSEDLLYDAYNTHEGCHLFPTCLEYSSHCDSHKTSSICRSILEKCSGNNSTMESANKINLGDCKSTFSSLDLDEFFSRLSSHHHLFPYGKPSLFTILLYLSSLATHHSTLQDKCELVSSSYCDYFRSVLPSLEGYCRSSFDECKGIDHKATRLCDELKKKLDDLGLIPKVGSFSKLKHSMNHNAISIGLCAQLMEECHYYSHLCVGLKGPCRTLGVLCYTYNKKDYYLRRIWDDLQIHIVSNGLTSSDLLNPKSSSGLYMHILELCSHVTVKEDLLFRWCLHPSTFFRKLYYGFKHDLSGLFAVMEHTSKPSFPQCAYYTTQCSVLTGVFYDSKHTCEDLQKICYSKNDFEHNFENILKDIDLSN
ncbi:hypothetical protein PMAC_000886 [Pneumocystis sp. 'macacae']|nr:hypothetical protein PMAC_000886 [Pneumocystis sp. 'macacae']